MMEEAYNIKNLIIRTFQHLLLEEIHTEKTVTVTACLENLIRNVLKEKPEAATRSVL